MKGYEIEVKLSRQEDGLWRAEVPSLPGCFVDGETVTEVLRDIQECAAMAIDIRLEAGELPADLLQDEIEAVHVCLPVVLDEHAFKRSGRTRSRRTAAADVS